MVVFTTCKYCIIYVRSDRSSFVFCDDVPRQGSLVIRYHCRVIIARFIVCPPTVQPIWQIEPIWQSLSREPIWMVSSRT